MQFSYLGLGLYQWLVAIFGSVCFLLLDPALSLLFGLIASLVLKVPPPAKISKWIKTLLPACIVGLGFGMNSKNVLEAGSMGIILSTATILGTLALGVFLGKILKVDRVSSLLVSFGTAICGGSAIIALAPVLAARSSQVGLSLGIVFILNALALLIFPVIGKYFELGGADFGLWAAIAIHDTSSVVAAASVYGAEALEVAVPVKLARALWIVPLVWFFAFRSGEKGNVKMPWFILFFLLASVIGPLINQIVPISHHITVLAKMGLSLTLFFIGLNIALGDVKSLGLTIIIQAVILWVLISSVSMFILLF